MLSLLLEDQNRADQFLEVEKGEPLVCPPHGQHKINQIVQLCTKQYRSLIEVCFYPFLCLKKQFFCQDPNRIDYFWAFVKELL